MTTKEKKSKQTQKGKQTKQQKAKETPGCLSFGKLDLIYKFDFTEKDLEKSEEEVQKDENGSKYYNIEDFNSIKDLQFIQDKKNIIDKIVLKPNNATLDQLLTANKISKKKMLVEYIPYGIPKFEGEEEFFKQIFNNINEKNHLDLNEKALAEDGNYSLKFEFNFKDKTHSFCVGTGGENEEEKKEGENEEEKKEENTEEKKEENPPEQNNEQQQEEKPEEKKEENTEEKKEENKEENKEEEQEPEDYEPNEAMKAEKIPKFSRKDSVLCNLDPKNKKYTLFYLNFDELKNIPGNFENNDLIELIYFLKKKGAKIFINYYKPEEPKEESNENKENKETKENKENADSKGKEKDKGKEKQNDEKEEKEMKCLNNLYYLTDLYFFDFKQAIEEFNKHYHFFTTDKSDKSINKQKLLDYFINGIASGTKREVDGDKYGFFLEDFLKFYVIHANKKKAKKNEFDCQLFPKINHNNIELIDKYKSTIKKNVNNYVSIFITFFISGVTSNGNVSDEVIIGSFLNALEIIKRKLECEKNNINLNENDLMKYKISEKNLAERIKELNLQNQEGDFVLDCTNKEKSELKEYVPLYDYHLVYYFRSYVNQKELKKKGFINDKGYIMYDPVHRKRMRPDLVKEKLNEEETQKKVENNIKNIDVGSRIKDKEIDSSKINHDSNLTTLKKLPKSKYGIVTKKDKKKKKEGKSPSKKRNKNEGSGESSGESGDEEDDNPQDYDEKGEVILLKDKLVH